MIIKKSLFFGQRILSDFREWGIFFALLLICGLMTLLSPYFLTTNNLFNVLLQAASISIIAAGFTVVLIAGEIDLSIGSAIGLVACVAAVLMIEVGLSPFLGITLSIFIGILLGLFNGLSTVIFRIPSFVVTLATLGIAHGTGLLLTAGRPVFGFNESYSFIGQGKIGPIPTPVILAIIVYAMIHFLLKKTSFGIQLYAVGGNREASELSGVRVNRIIVLAFVISGVCGALSGIILSSRLDAGHGDFGASNLLDAVAAVVVGGTSLMGGAGSVIGTLGGVLIIATIRNGLILMNVQAFWQEIVVGLIILIAVIVNQISKNELSFSSK